MRNTISFSTLLLVALSLDGCSLGSPEDGIHESPTGRVFGGPSSDKVFASFQGEWHFEDRKFDPKPEYVGVSGGPDITITGHVIRFASGLLVREVRLCQTVATVDGIECEGWHHEDIHDPGDMQRVDCKLRRVGANLEFRWRILSSGDFSDDPVIAMAGYTPPDRSQEEFVPPWCVETYSPKSSK